MHQHCTQHNVNYAILHQSFDVVSQINADPSKGWLLVLNLSTGGNGADPQLHAKRHVVGLLLCAISGLLPCRQLGL